MLSAYKLSELHSIFVTFVSFKHDISVNKCIWALDQIKAATIYSTNMSFNFCVCGIKNEEQSKSPHQRQISLSLKRIASKTTEFLCCIQFVAKLYAIVPNMLNMFTVCLEKVFNVHNKAGSSNHSRNFSSDQDPCSCKISISAANLFSSFSKECLLQLSLATFSLSRSKSQTSIQV